MTNVVRNNTSCEIVAPVFGEYRDILTRYIQSRVNDVLDCEELLSEVLLKIYDNCEKLENVRSMEAWLITVARNTINDYFRDKQKRQMSPLTVDLTEEEEANLYQELETCLPSLIEKLPAKYAGPLADYELKGIPQKKLAETYQLSESGLKSRVQRGRKMLKDLFQQYCNHLIEQEDDCGDCKC